MTVFALVEVSPNGHDVMGIYTTLQSAKDEVQMYLNSFAEFERKTFMYEYLDRERHITLTTKDRTTPEWLHFVRPNFWTTTLYISGSKCEFYISEHEVEE